MEEVVRGELIKPVVESTHGCGLREARVLGGISGQGGF